MPLLKNALSLLRYKMEERNVVIIKLRVQRCHIIVASQYIDGTTCCLNNND